MYDGMWKDDVRYGFGKFIYPDGNIYEVRRVSLSCMPSYYHPPVFSYHIEVEFSKFHF